jgi:hypothetical protein
MSSINHRLWLKVSMSGGSYTGKETINKASPLSKEQTLDKILSASSGELGDLEGIMKSIVKNSDGYWYIPLSGALPSYAFDGTYQKQTPDWGAGGRAMADIAGGLAKAAGDLAGNLPGVGGGARRLLTGVGDFLHSFTGDIDSPKIWMRSEFKAISLGAKLAFENRAEFAYYRAAETWFTLMTTPIPDFSAPATKTVNSVIKAFTKYAKKGGPLDQFEIVALQRPFSGVSAFDVVVGEALPLTRPGNALKLRQKVDDQTLTLFAMDKANLSAFSVQYGGEQARGIDQDGVPRVVSFSFTFEPALVSSGINGLRRMFKQNAARYSGRVTRGYDTSDDYKAAGKKYAKTFAAAEGEATDRNDKGERLAPTSASKRIADAAAKRAVPWSRSPDATYAMLQLPPQTPPTPPGVSMRLHADAMARIVLKKGEWLGEAIMYHIMNANLSVAAVEYMAGRLIRIVGPVRSITSAAGKSVSVPAGLPGFIYNTGRKLSNAIPGGVGRL